MRIGFCGTQSIGKTTLVKELSKLPEFEGYYIAVERSKYLRDLGIPLNTDSTLKGQIIFLAERASELMRENLLTDRTVWDVCAFTWESRTILLDQANTYTELAMELKDEYDIVFYISPEGIDIEDNGVRTIDSDYRDSIDHAIGALLSVHPPKHFVSIKGTTEERIKIVLEEVNKYLSKT